jgi:diaminohydroxyphosphoribosylaminopyrimidine deaminase/5-amino-6-(5-phosphoribosylamino)uracil reductase
MKSLDEKYMLEALRLAKKGMGWTFPNPMVGAVIVKNNKIIGRGYHKKIDMPHAETEAFTSATEDPAGATMYVTLEPCSHFGRTPPCVDEIIEKGITKIICAIVDPNYKVHGTGLKKLKDAGIQVETGLLTDKARLLNEGFFTFHQKRRPFITLKFAASLDGKIATRTGDSKWITNEKERAYARSLRAEYHAILVGINTVLQDNPNLGARQIGKKDPLRIILDSTLKIPMNSDVLRDNNVLIVTTKKADEKKLEDLQKKPIAVLRFQNDIISIPDLMKELYKKEIVSIFIEGGAETLGSFADAKIVDRVYACYAPIIIGGRGAVSAVKGEGVAKVLDALHLHDIHIKKFDDNFVVIGSV